MNGRGGSAWIRLLIVAGSALFSGCQGSIPGTSPADSEVAGPAASTGRVKDPRLYLPGVAREEAPAEFKVRFETTRGEFLVAVKRDLAPHGADRVWNLVQVGFFEDATFFRAIKGFVVQFGVHGDPEINRLWAEASIPDDPAAASNLRGSLSFAHYGPNTRAAQVFINLADNSSLDGEGFSPFGRVMEGMGIVDTVFTGYGELHPKGKGPRPKLLGLQGNKYLRMQFPEMDYILRAVIVNE